MTIDKLYSKFFEDFKIDGITGKLAEYPNLKFVTMPFIGSKYFSSNPKILFVGMDVGKDETIGSFQGFEERNESIEKECNFNPHIAGTYCSSLFLLKDDKKWNNVWEEISNYNTCSQATKTAHHSETENPLSYVALTNLHKFVTIGRENRSGSADRKFLQREVEENFLLEEIKSLEPDIILFQGKIPLAKTVENIRKLNIRMIKAMHPSNRKREGRNPKKYVEKFQEIK